LSNACHVITGVSFPLVVLDEGSQAAEHEALIPLTRAAEHVVLVGDHLQLPPVCNSEDAAAAGLAVSLFERLMAAGVPSAMLQVGMEGNNMLSLLFVGELRCCSNPVHYQSTYAFGFSRSLQLWYVCYLRLLLLQVQYRMHPMLSAFPNAAFYGGRLTDGVTAGQRLSPQPFPWPQPDAPLLFVDVAEGSEEVAAGGSKLNRAEADMLQQVRQLGDCLRLTVLAM
jgi:regulator of nonsense transcripts 1